MKSSQIIVSAILIKALFHQCLMGPNLQSINKAVIAFSTGRPTEITGKTIITQTFSQQLRLLLPRRNFNVNNLSESKCLQKKHAARSTNYGASKILRNKQNWTIFFSALFFSSQRISCKGFCVLTSRLHEQRQKDERGAEIIEWHSFQMKIEWLLQCSHFLTVSGFTAIFPPFSREKSLLGSITPAYRIFFHMHFFPSVCTFKIHKCSIRCIRIFIQLFTSV